LEMKHYRTLSVRIDGYSIIVDIADRKWDAVSILQLSTDLAELSEQIAWMEEARNAVFLFDGNIPDPGFAEDDIRLFLLAEPIGKLTLPVIAAIRGDAVGPGLELALACDIRIGVEGSRFGLPQVGQGIMPSNGGTVRLARLIGPGRAMHMILTGEDIGSGEALRIGLLNRVVDVASLTDTAVKTAREMAAKSPLSTSFAKDALYPGMDLTLDQGIGKELDLYLQLFGTRDRIEGVSAFREKRKPEFKGD